MRISLLILLLVSIGFTVVPPLPIYAQPINICPTFDTPSSSTINSGQTADLTLRAVNCSTGTAVQGATVDVVARVGSTVVWSTSPGGGATTNASGDATIVVGPLTNGPTVNVTATVSVGSSSGTANIGLTVTGGVAPTSPPPPATTPSTTTPSSSSGSGVSIPNPINCETAQCLITQVIRYVFGIIAVLATFMFIWGGLLMLTSAGNAQRVKQAKETLTYAAIGIVVILLSWSVIQFVIKGIR